MTVPLVSVNMITYNHAPYIAGAIEGVLQQKTSFPFELVIGEDCSTDGTRDIVLDYQKKHPDIIRVIMSDKNVGMKMNGNRTRKASRGKYIAVCEGDDYWHHPGKLQRQAEYLETHPECGLVFSSYDVYHVRSKKRIKDFIKYRKWVIPEKWDVSDIVEGKHGILTCTVMARRALCDQIIETDPYLYQSDQFLMGDTQLWAEIAVVAELHYISESLATHIITDESATRSRDIKKRLRFAISGAELMIYLCKKYDLPSSLRKMHQATWCNYSLKYSFYSKSAKIADEVLRKNKTFTWKQWLWYYGAKYVTFCPLHAAACLILNLFGKRQNPWL